MAYSFVYSMNTEDFDDEYMQRTGVGVSCDYGDGDVGEVVYALIAMVDEGGADAGWTVEDFVRYWNERGTVWQAEVTGCGDDAGTGGIVRTWTGKRGFGCTECYIALKAA